MLLIKYDPTQSTHKNNSTDLIKSINKLNIYVGLFYKQNSDFFDLFWKSLTFLGFFESIELIQIYQSLKVIRLNHLHFENEFALNSLGKGSESIQSILRKKLIESNQSTRSS